MNIQPSYQSQPQPQANLNFDLNFNSFQTPTIPQIPQNNFNLNNNFLGMNSQAPSNKPSTKNIN